MSTPSTGQLAQLPLARSTLERAAERRTDHLVGELLAEPGTRVLELAGGRASVTGDPLTVDLRAPVPQDAERLGVFLGQEGTGDAAVPYVAVAVGEGYSEPPGQRGPRGRDADGRVGLREVGQLLDARGAGLFTLAAALLNWHAVHTRCPRCGEATVPVLAGWVRRCVADGSDHYPRTDPAVIMTVVDDDDRVLLGSQSDWLQGRYSTLAGFVEPGESLEAAVRREVQEEVGVLVGEVTYLGSQPWPFPASVMIGFRARARSTEIRVDGVEITQARWFSRDELSDATSAGEVVLPGRLSIARALLEEWYGGVLQDSPATWR